MTGWCLVATSSGRADGCYRPLLLLRTPQGGKEVRLETQVGEDRWMRGWCKYSSL